jgi:hypothetical protein
VLIVSYGIEIPKKTSVLWNAKLALTQHAKAVEHRNNVRVQVD